MAEINHTTIEQAIEALLEADSDVYDNASTDGTKLISIEEGIPLASDMQTELLPGAFITMESERIRNKASLSSNSITGIEHEIRYRIRIALSDYGNKQSESILNTLQKEILEVIESNNKLSSNVDSCFPESVIRVQELANKNIFARDIVIKCIVTTN